MRGFVAVTWTADNPAPDWTIPMEPRLTFSSMMVNGLSVNPWGLQQLACFLRRVCVAEERKIFIGAVPSYLKF